MIRFSKEIMSDGEKRVKKFLKTTGRIPNWLFMKDTNKKEHYLLPKEYNGLFESQNVFRVKHGRQPNYTTLNSTSNNPLVMNYQNNGYNCCPASLSMISMLLYSYTSEETLAKTLKTSKTGTDPKSLKVRGKQAGFNITTITRNRKAVTKSLKNKNPVLAHIDTKPASCLGYRNNYGHYIAIYNITGNALTGYKYQIADPTKGLKNCKTSILDGAMLNRKINYYSVSIA